MANRKEIGKINFEIDNEELERIIASGRLGRFIDSATSHFNDTLKAELVNSASSGAISLVNLDDWEFGTGGPRGPFPHIFGEMRKISERIQRMEIVLEQYK